MNIGELRYKITFQILSNETTNENGFPLSEDERFTDFKSAWSTVYPLKGTEFWSAKTTYSESTVKFTCRYIPGITSDMRIQYGKRTFNIVGVIDVDERHKWLQIMATELL